MNAVDAEIINAGLMRIAAKWPHRGVNPEGHRSCRVEMTAYCLNAGLPKTEIKSRVDMFAGKMARQGWRIFRCECGHIFRLPTRDCYSPSGEGCPQCGDWCVPVCSEVDISLLVDAFGNLEAAHQ